MVDVDSIIKLVKRHFNIKGTLDVNPLTGDVDVQGDVSFKGLPDSQGRFPVQFGRVTGTFSCVNKGLTTLQGAPHEVGANFECSYNKLTDLQGGPLHVGGDLYCYNNPLTTLNGMPETIKGSMVCVYLHDLPLLRTLNCQGHITFISGTEEFTPDIVIEILNRHKGQGRAGAIKAAGELIRAGFKDNARW